MNYIINICVGSKKEILFKSFQFSSVGHMAMLGIIPLHVDARVLNLECMKFFEDCVM